MADEYRRRRFEAMSRYLQFLTVVNYTEAALQFDQTIPMVFGSDYESLIESVREGHERRLWGRVEDKYPWALEGRGKGASVRATTKILGSGITIMNVLRVGEGLRGLT
jgi:hypothetical protein